MEICWPVPIKRERIYFAYTSTYIVLIFKPRWGIEESSSGFIVWDIQTGVVIGGDGLITGHADKVIFHEDKRTITFVDNLCFYTYGTLNSTRLCTSKIPSSWGMLGAHWVNKDTLQFAVSSETGGKPMINIYTLQPTLIPPLHPLSLFPIPDHLLSLLPAPYYEMKFSFSHISFHASFATSKGVVVLDVQDSRLLLDIKIPQSPGVHTLRWEATQSPGQFSPDGCFFAYKISSFKICVWQDTPTGYVPWCNLKPRLPVEGFSWSPTSTSIFCWGTGEILLLHVDSHPNPLFPNGDNLNNQKGNHLVAYSSDWTYIVIVRDGDSIVTVLDCHSGTTQWLINVDAQIQEIKIVKNTVFAVAVQKLVSWDLEAGGTVSGVHKTLAIDAKATNLTLSHDCSQIAFLMGNEILLYDLKAQKILQSFDWGSQITDIQFSPDGLQLWFTCRDFLPHHSYLQKLDITEDWGSVKVAGMGLENEWSWVNLFSPSQYCVGISPEWVTNSRGKKCIWLPPHWRAEYWEKVAWNGNFLAFLEGCYPVPIIIEFQP